MPNRPPVYRPLRNAKAVVGRRKQAGDSYYHSQHWKMLRDAAMKRDGRRCQAPADDQDDEVAVPRKCGATARVVNHKRPRQPVQHPTAHDVLDNLECLCAKHDNRFHREKGKR